MSGTAPDPEALAGHAASFATRQEDAAGVWTLMVSGEIDVATSPELRRQLNQLADRDTTTIVVDLGGVSFIDSSGLGVLVGVLNRLEEEGRDGILVLEGLQDSVRKVFDITGLSDVFTIR